MVCLRPMSAARPKLVVSRKRTSGRWGPSTIMGGKPTSCCRPTAGPSHYRTSGRQPERRPT